MKPSADADLRDQLEKARGREFFNHLIIQQKDVIQKEETIKNLENEINTRLENSKAVQSIKGILGRKNEILKKLKAKLASYVYFLHGSIV